MLDDGNAVYDGVVHVALEAHGAQHGHGIKLRAHQAQAVEIDQEEVSCLSGGEAADVVRPSSRAEPRVASFSTS